MNNLHNKMQIRACLGYHFTFIKTTKIIVTATLAGRLPKTWHFQVSGEVAGL